MSSRELLFEVGELGDALCEAIDREDVIGAIAATTRMRAARATLAREGVTTIAPKLDDLADVVEVTSIALRARGADVAMQRWLARELPADDFLRRTPLGSAVIADAMLPPIWDAEIDLVVLFGPGWGLVGTILRDLGQRRLIVVGGDVVDGAIAVEDERELVSAIRTLVPCPPERLAVRGDGPIAAVRDTLSDLRIHRNTVRAFSRSWIDHGLANLPAIARNATVSSLGDRCRGVPIVIVAPGPSLAKNVHLLHELGERAIICAVSHALKPVVAAGVTPDLVLTVDPQDVRYHFAGCDLSRTTLVNAATVHPSLFELPARNFVSLSANCAIDDWIFGEDAGIPGGGSVATTALSLALALGCSPIIFVGLDLAFPDGKYYVATSHDGGARAVVENGVMRVDGWSREFRAMKSTGGPSAATERTIELPAWTPDGTTTDRTVPSSFMFGLFHRWFVERLARVETPVYSCTEGGAAIPGMAHRPFADVIATLPRRELPRFDDRVDRRRAFAERFTAYASRLRRIRSLARKALDADPAKLARIERALVRALAPMQFISLLAQHEIERAQDIASHTGGDYLGASRNLFATLDEVIAHLEPAIRSAISKLV